VLGEEMNRKASLTVTQIILLVLGLIVLVVGIWFAVKGKGLGEDAVAFAPKQDFTCRSATQLDSALGKAITNADSDALKDSCDSCVCDSPTCANDEKEEGLPVACADPQDKTKYNKDVCNQDSLTLKKISGGWQCKPVITKTT
jgi:hypothetical protein